MSNLTNCPQCGAGVIPRSHFCLQCGFMLSPPAASSKPASPEPVAPAPAAPAAPEPPTVDLVLIRSPELKEVRFRVRDRAQIGRSEGNMIFREDPYISPLHATLFYRGGELFIRDEGSFNGVFTRLREPVTLLEGEVFIAGEQMYCVEEYSAGGSFLPDDAEEGVRFFANPKPTSAPKRLTQLLEGGGRGLCAPFTEGSLSVGRQGCDLNFPNDRFMSSRHCHVSVSNDKIVLTDMGSRNGTFVQVKGEAAINIGDFLLIGKQLLQVQPHAPNSSQSQVSV